MNGISFFVMLHRISLKELPQVPMRNKDNACSEHSHDQCLLTFAKYEGKYCLCVISFYFQYVGSNKELYKMMMEVVVEFHAVKISYFWWSWLLHICLSVNIHDLETWLKQNIYRHTMVCIYLAIVFDRKNVSKSRSLYMQVYYHYPLFTMKRLEKRWNPLHENCY